MKKIILMPFVALCVCSCADDSQPVVNEVESVPVTFACQGFEIDTRPMTRGELTADGKAMTDIWILDYIGDDLTQQLHQVSTDADFGTPTMNLSVGHHNIYFVASRSTSPTLDTDARTLTFGRVLDTFYKSLSLNVSATSAGAQAVTLDRIVTKLKLTFEDPIPDGAASFNVTPAQWYYGINYVTGIPTTPTTSQNIPVSIPSSYIGLTDQSLSIYGFSPADEWTTDIAFNCKASDNSVLGQATITAAPMQRNRITSYSGPLFSGNSAMTLAISADWLTSYQATW